MDDENEIQVRIINKILYRYRMFDSYILDKKHFKYSHVN